MTKNTTPLAGFFIINKSPSLTSHDVVASIRHITAQTKVGHTGTLDPFATGVLVVATGSTTRLIQYTHDLQKTYEATITLGAVSDTDDNTARHFTSISTRQPTRKEIEDVLATFTGTSQQIPPTYAAIKIKGKKLYEYAREGKEVERQPRTVTIHSIELLEYNYPEIKIRATVSTGTYIRALARDIGEELKTGAHLSQLHRSAIGNFTDKKSVKLEQLTQENWPHYLHNPKELLVHIPSITLDLSNVAKLQQGREVTLAGQPVSKSANQHFVILDEQQNLVGIAEYTPTSRSLQAKTILPLPSNN